MILIGLLPFFFFLVGFWILFRVPVCRKHPRSEPAMPKISVIIPARNEEHNILRLITTLKNQNIRPDEIIVVDDQSEDKTRTVAEKSGVNVISSQVLPSGWLGKPWACHQGANAAKGDIFVFLDADAFFEDNGFQKLIETYLSVPGVVSVNPYHRMYSSYEYFSAFFNVMQMIGMNCFSFKRDAQPAGMFGPCLVISREDYKKIGGYESVKQDILENYVLSGFLKKHNIPVSLYSGRGVLNVRLYPEGIGQLIAGWSKSFTTGAKNTPRKVMRLSSMWISGLTMAPVFVCVSLFTGSTLQLVLSIGLYVLYVVQMFIHLRRIGSFPFWVSISYPIPLIFFIFVFGRAGAQIKKKKSVLWKGRNISSE